MSRIAKIAKFTDAEIRKVAAIYKAALLKGTSPAIFALLNNNIPNLSKREIDNWIKENGGAKRVKSMLAQPTEELEAALIETVTEIRKRITAGTIADRELLEVYKLLSRFEEIALRYLSNSS